jgi:hypothetical protein
MHGHLVNDAVAAAGDPPPLSAAAPAWGTQESCLRRTRAFLLLAALYVSANLIFSWLDFKLFAISNWYFFSRESSLFEIAYRYVLTFLPVLVWLYFLLWILTRYSFLTHRRVAFVVVLLGLIFFEADMRWYFLSRKHVTWTEIQVLFSADPTVGLGLRASDYETFWLLAGMHALALSLCALLAGPEFPALCRAVWNGPIGATYLGKAGTAVVCLGGRVGHWLRVHRVVAVLDHRLVVAAVCGLFLADPVIVWGLEQRDEDADETRSPIRDLAENNPLRMHSLDRLWDNVVLKFSAKAQDLAAANEAFAGVDASLASAPCDRLCLSCPCRPATPYNVVLIQVESLNADVVAKTDLPFLRTFSKKCLNLKNHHAAGNCTHYGILGLLHGNPVTFYEGYRSTSVPCAYLEHFKKNDYKTRLIARRVMDHHHLGLYIPNWTQPAFDDAERYNGSDWPAIPVCHEELAKPGPRLVYLFYHHTHYPYWHQPQFSKHQPEVDYDFNYYRTNLLEWKDQIINRYKNSLQEWDAWLAELMGKVDLTRTIVVITGDHGEEMFEQGRLGHCSSFNRYQTMPPCWIYIPGVEPGDVEFTTSNSDIMPTIADALGWQEKPETLGRSLFQPVPFRYALVADFEFTKPWRWAVVTEDRKLVAEEVERNRLQVTNLVDWNGRRLSFRDQPEQWRPNLQMLRYLENDLKKWHPQ